MTPPPRKTASARRRRPTTNPELAVRRAERGPALPEPKHSTLYEAAPLRARADDPPSYRDTWIDRYATAFGPHPSGLSEIVYVVPTAPAQEPGARMEEHTS